MELLNGLILREIHSWPELGTIKESNTEEKVFIRLKAAGINRRDIWIYQGQYAKIQLPCILGSDGSGYYHDQPVIINPGKNWGDDERFQGKNYSITGMPSNGTFADGIWVEPSQIVPKPQHLTFEEASCIALSGVTAWRALMVKCAPRPGDKLLITGIGGGVATFVLQFAVAFGLEVYVTSGSDEKIQKAINLGAKGGVNYKNASFVQDLKSITGGVDHIVDGTAGDPLAKVIETCKPGAHVAIYGGTLGSIPNLPPQAIFWKQITISGSTMGSDQDFKEMMHFIETYKIRPVIDRIFPLNDVQTAFQHVLDAKHFGKVVFAIDL